MTVCNQQLQLKGAPPIGHKVLSIYCSALLERTSKSCDVSVFALHGGINQLLISNAAFMACPADHEK
uniref:Uncharacterized protein n=1 Tax=Arundo donax TaxID=35708 RepID=A0A0A9HTI5_ARUDO